MAVIAGALLLAAPLAALSPRFVDAHAATTEPAHQDVPAKEHEPALELHVTRPGELQQETPSRDRSARSVDQAQASQEAPCIPGVSGNRAITESVRSHNGRREVFWDTQRCSLRIELEGVRFTADERTIEDIEPGGLFTMAQEGLGPDRALRVQPGSRGLEFEYRVEGDVEPFGTEAQEWLAELIPTIFRVTGVQMAERLDRILERGGTEAVFSEVRQIHSDHVAGAYLGELMNTQDLTDAETSTLFAVARAQIESDHELGQLLRTAWRDDLSPAARSEYMDAAQTLESDHELAQVIHSLLEASLSLEEGATVLALAATLRSDHETGGVLRALLDAVGPGVVQREAFFEVASTLESDHELGRVLKHAMDRAQLSADQARTVIDLSRTMSSDHEQGAVLKALIEVTDGQVGDPASFFEAVGQLASDHEMGSVLKLYVMTEGLPEAAVLGVLDTADALSSDHERAELLRRILDRQWPFTDAVQDRFVESAEGISSEYERDRTLAELGRRASR